MRLGNAYRTFRGSWALSLSALVLAIGLLATFLYDHSVRHSSFDALNTEFQIRSQDIYERIRQRLFDYEQVLRGGAGLFASTPEVGRREWRRYVNSLRLQDNLPGLQGLGFARLVRAADKAGHVDGIRKEGFPDYRIFPEGERESYTPSVYLEPFTGPNLRPFGYDLSTEPVRRAAMEAARDQDRVTISGKVPLVQEVKADVQAGFLMFLPIYRADAPHESIAERRQNILGWVYAPFRMNDFMKSLVGSGLKLNNIYFDIIISDQDEIRPDMIMYHYDDDIDPVITGSRVPLLLFRQTLTFGGHTWTVVLHSPALFDDGRAFDSGALMIEAAGSLISLLLAVIVWLAAARRPFLQAPNGREAAGGGGRWGRTAPPYALAAALSLAAGYLVFKADESESQAHARAERAEVENRVNVIRLRLERALTVPIVRTRGMAAQILAHGDVLPEEFKKIAEVLLRGQPTIRNIGVSHGTLLDLIYPLAGNESALGMDYRRAEWQWPVVKRAIETHAPVVQGPIKLIQGGTGLIARDPVYLPDATGGENRFFGIISIVLDIPAIFAEAGLDRPDLPIAIAIRGRDGLGAAGEMISGDPALFDRNPAKAEVEFPYGRWLLAAAPKQGWGRDEPPLSMSRLLGGGFFLFVTLISFGTANHLIERSRLHRKLASSEERFRLLLQVASDGVHILDRDGNLVLSSRSFLDMLGYTPEEAAQLSVKDWDALYLPEEFLPRLEELMRTPTIFETRHRRRDGSIIEVEINARGIVLDGAPLLYASSRDITERKEHEAEIKRAKLAAEEAARVKSDFLAMMSHEIRTPITSVLGMADLLQHTPLTEEQAGYLGTLGTSTKTLLTILNDVLDISKLEAGKVTIEATPFPLRGTVADVLGFARATATAKSLVIDLTFAAEVPERVVGDPTRLNQILFNLLNNAIKFTERGFVHLRMSVAGWNGGKVTVLTEIEDSGIGIEQAQLNVLFKAFSQADQSTTRRFGGTGLGLAITRKLIDLMGGDIGVDSEPGKGSRFWFTLPFAVADGHGGLADAAGAAPQTKAPPRPLRLLLAEDNPVNRMLVRSMLEKFGHSVDTACNGREAVEKLAAGDYDAALMDMQMPEMDGEEATRLIRAMPPPKNRMPVIALTADVMAEHRQRYFGAGVDDLVAKPIDWDNLAAALDRHAGKAG